MTRTRGLVLSNAGRLVAAAKAWIVEMSHSAFTTWKWLCKEHALQERAATGRAGMPLWISVKQRLDKQGRPMAAPECDLCP